MIPSTGILPAVFYRQEKEPTCVSFGLASALHYLGLQLVARQLTIDGRAFMNGNNPSKIMQYTGQWINSHPSLSQKWHMIKLTPDDDVLQLNTTHQPALIVMRESDDTQWHAITIVNNLIFDSSQSTACFLNTENLDMLCAVGSGKHNVYSGIHTGYHFLKRKSRKRRKKRPQILSASNDEVQLPAKKKTK